MGFHVELSVRETGLDFTKLRSAAVSLFTTKRPRDLIALNSNNALLEFLLEGSPEVREYCRDSRKEVDRRLKTVCEEFISGAARGVVKDLQTFQKQVDNQRSSDKNANISREPWARPELLQSYSAQAMRQLKKQFPTVQRAMQLYLCNKENEFILFRPIRNSVMSSFIAFLQTVRADFTADEQIIIQCPYRHYRRSKWCRATRNKKRRRRTSNRRILLGLRASPSMATPFLRIERQRCSPRAR